MSSLKNRRSGVLMPIFSLPSKYGIGSLGKAAYKFIDFLNKAGQTYWQILPIEQTGPDNSPYLTYSSRAGNVKFIDIDLLIEDNYITKNDLDECGIKILNTPEYCKINYKNITKSRDILFNKVFVKFFENPPSDYKSFCKENNSWLEDFALFMTIKKIQQEKFNNIESTKIQQWPDKFKYRNEKALMELHQNYSKEVEYFKMLQYFFFKQWNMLKEYAHKQGVKIIGDIAYYVSVDSSDAWTNPHIFKIDKDFTFKTYSGCPPNKSNNKKSKGQVWGSPVYDWEYLKSSNYNWWISRLRDALNLYDVIRIDHFKGFESYYCIDGKTMDPKTGVYKPGPGLGFWKIAANELNFKNISDMPIFVEDLGLINQNLKKLIADTGFYGIKVLQFAFNKTNHPEIYKGQNRLKSSEMYLPHNYPTSSIAYVGTHDNDTLMGWINTIDKDILQNAKNYFEENDIHKLFDKMLLSVINSKSNICILCVQDLLKLNTEGRINVPGTIENNWTWQLSKNQFNILDPKKLYDLTKKANRL